MTATMTATRTLQLLLGAALAMAPGAAHAVERCEPFTVFHDHATHKRSFVDHGDQGPSVGDRQISSAPLRNAAGDVVGHLDVESTLVHGDDAGNGRLIADLVAQFPTGMIILKIPPSPYRHDFDDASKFPAPSADIARVIVGGSGAFLGASGTVEVDHRDDSTEMKFNLSCR
jgi:hypothetical protein